MHVARGACGVRRAAWRVCRVWCLACALCWTGLPCRYGNVEYVALAKIRDMIRDLDPYRLMFGTIACGETWSVAHPPYSPDPPHR